MFGLFAYVGGSSNVYIQHFGLAPPVYGVLFGLCAGGLITGSQVNPRLLMRFGSSRVLRGAVRAYWMANLLLAGFAFTGRFGVAAVFLPILASLTIAGVLLPNATVGALSRQAAHAGSASALMGTLQFLLAAVSGSLVGILTDGTARPMSGLMLLGATGAVLADRARHVPREVERA